MVLGCVFFCFCTVSSSLSLLKFSILFDVFFFWRIWLRLRMRREGKSVSPLKEEIAGSIRMYVCFFNRDRRERYPPDRDFHYFYTRGCVCGSDDELTEPSFMIAPNR